MTKSSSNGTYLDDCLLRRVIFMTGKGGVGKSTLTWATALACQKRGARVAVASWNPFETERVPVVDTGISWIPLEMMSAFREYVLNILKFESLFNAVFDNHVLKTFLHAAPGLTETVISGKIWDLYDRRAQDLLIVDLPASGHAVSFFQSPLGVQKLFGIGLVHKEAKKITAMFESPETRIDLVALPEELPLTEVTQLKQKLDDIFPFHFGFLHLNQCTPRFDLPEASRLAGWPASVGDCVHRYEERRRQEQEADAMLPEIGLPVLRLPRLTSETLRETVIEVARLLEGGGTP